MYAVGFRQTLCWNTSAALDTTDMFRMSSGSVTGSSSCAPSMMPTAFAGCSAGTYYLARAQTCVICKAGTYSSSGAESCSICAEVTFFTK